MHRPTRSRSGPRPGQSSLPTLNDFEEALASGGKEDPLGCPAVEVMAKHVCDPLPRLLLHCARSFKLRSNPKRPPLRQGALAAQVGRDARSDDVQRLVVASASRASLNAEAGESPGCATTNMRAWNRNPTPFAWTKPAAALIKSHRRMLKAFSTTVH